MGCLSAAAWNFSHDSGPLPAAVLFLAQCCLSLVSGFKRRLVGTEEFFKEQESDTGRDSLAI